MSQSCKLQELNRVLQIGKWFSRILWKRRNREHEESGISLQGSELFGTGEVSRTILQKHDRFESEHCEQYDEGFAQIRGGGILLRLDQRDKKESVSLDFMKNDLSI